MIKFIIKLLDIAVHLDRYIGDIVSQFGLWTYLILFVVIFAETGLVVAPFFPGDSLLFAAGAVAAIGGLNVYGLFITLSAAAVLGNVVNYWIGYRLGPGVFKKEDSKFFKKEYLDKTHRFYERHGGKTIVIARFLPIIRTFAPFVAGIGRMTYWKFIIYNIIGSVLWVAIFIFGGYFFGNLPVVKKNFFLVILAIIAVSLIPAGVGFIKNRKLKHRVDKNKADANTV